MINNNKYDDIINLPPPISKKHPRMSRENRAAQFSPFAALTGYDSAINEKGRLTENKRQLSEDEKTVISEKLRMISECLPARVEITYFIPDKRKDGGRYENRDCVVRRIDDVSGRVILQNGEFINIFDIMEIHGNNFKNSIY